MAHTSSRAKKPPKPRSGQNAALLFRFRARDTAFGVTLRTAHALSQHLGMSETQVMHVALAKMARDTLPAYEQDDGPLTDKQFARLKEMVPQGRMKVTKSLL